MTDFQKISALQPKTLLRNYGSHWTIADALKIRIDDPTTTMPLIDYNFPSMTDNVWLWDTWALRDIYGKTVTYRGWHVIFSLVAPRGEGDDLMNSWINRNDYSYIGFFYSKTGNGSDWVFGGRVLDASADLRNWEWSGCAVMRDGTTNTLDMFFTSVGTQPASVPCHTVGTINADTNGVWFEGFDKQTDMFQADGVNYANFAEDSYWDFRDPHVFQNPEDGRIYALFEGNVPGMRGQFVIGPDETGYVPPGYTVAPGAEYGAAAIGVARLKDGAYEAGTFGVDQWELMPALVTALGVNDQTERPHIVFKDGLTYLFTISHHSTYSGNSTGPDGVYGFVSEQGLFGSYEPLNGSGLVLGNPSEAPLETYSHFVDPAGYVQSFINYLPDPAHVPANPYDATAPNTNVTYRIGGTLAPTVKLVLEGRQTFLTDTYNYGQIFADHEWCQVAGSDTRPTVTVSATS